MKVVDLDRHVLTVASIRGTEASGGRGRGMTAKTVPRVTRSVYIRDPDQSPIMSYRLMRMARSRRPRRDKDAPT